MKVLRSFNCGQRHQFEQLPDYEPDVTSLTAWSVECQTFGTLSAEVPVPIYAFFFVMTVHSGDSCLIVDGPSES